MLENNKSLLDVRNAVFGYGQNIVIKSVSVSISEGSKVCLLGGNGSGKSTLLKGIVGLVDIWGGALEFCGKSIDKLRADERHGLGLAFVPQDRKLFSQKTVGENLELGCLAGLKSAKERESRLARLLDTLPRLKEHLRRPAGLLSGGEQQLVALGRALMSQPRLLLMDEPTAGLAPVWIDRLFEVMDQVMLEYSPSLLLVEQNVEVGLALTNQAYVLQNGVIAFEGSSASLAKDERLVRSYLG